MTLCVLSIDGGGVRAVATTRVLAELENLTGRPISDTFDLVTASSSGAVVALGLTAPSRHGHARQSAAEIHDLWLERGHQLGPTPPPWRTRVATRLQSWLRSDPPTVPAARPNSAAVSAVSSRPDGGGRLLESYLGEVPFGASLCDLLVPVHDLGTGRAVLFRSWEFAHSRTPSMADVARASSALPTPLGAVRMTLGSRERLLAHGGFVASNPSLFAFSQALARRDPKAKPGIVLVSLGSRRQRRQRQYTEPVPVPQPGALASAFVDGSSSAQHQLLESFVEDRDDVRYMRFEVPLNGCEPQIHSRDPGDVACLATAADQAVAEGSSELERIADAVAA